MYSNSWLESPQQPAWEDFKLSLADGKWDRISLFRFLIKISLLTSAPVQGYDLGLLDDDTNQAHHGGLSYPRPDLWVLTLPVATRLPSSQTSPQHKSQKKQPQERAQVFPALMHSHIAAIVSVSNAHKNKMVVFIMNLQLKWKSGKKILNVSANSDVTKVVIWLKKELMKKQQF